MNMDIMDADRFLNQYDWFARKIQAVTQEAGLWTVDLTGQMYEPGMAVSPLNLEDFPDDPAIRFRIAQMVEPIVMEHGKVRKTGTAMLAEDLEEASVRAAESGNDMIMTEEKNASRSTR